MTKHKKGIKRSSGPDVPAPTVTRTAGLQPIEGGFRLINYVVKKIQLGEVQEATDALARAALDYDPSSASAQATGVMSSIDAWIQHGENFSGRKTGSLSAETKYISALMDRFPNEDTAGLWSKLRLIVDNPDHASNPTPGECPFSKGYRDARLTVLKRDKKGREKPYVYETFRNRVSEIRRRRAAGQD